MNTQLSQAVRIELVDLVNKGQLRQAEVKLRRFAADGSNDPFLYRVMSVVRQKQGFLNEAIQAAEQCLEIAPGDVETNINLVLLLAEVGQLDAARDRVVKIVSAIPHNSRAHFALGAVMLKSGDLSAAERSLKHSLSISPDDYSALFNLGLCLQKQNKLSEALATHQKLILVEPDSAEAHDLMGGSLRRLNKIVDAEASYATAIKLGPDSAAINGNMGSLLKDIGALERAEFFFRRASTLDPDNLDAKHDLGYVLSNMGRIAEALEIYSGVIERDPSALKARLRRLPLLFSLKHPLFLRELEFFSVGRVVAPVLGSMISRARLRYGTELSNPFCEDPLAYFARTDLRRSCSFEADFVRPIIEFLESSRTEFRGDQAILINGEQTFGSVFDCNNVLPSFIQDCLVEEVRRYKENFEDSNDGFIRNWPKNWILNGWIIRLTSGGEIAPHIHEDGWCSGVVYISVPPKSDKFSGSLVVSLGDDADAEDTAMNTTHIVDVVTGDLVLFPSSLMHRTIPFEAQEDRIVLAFDVMPLPTE